jgi:hypothetical protein
MDAWRLAVGCGNGMVQVVDLRRVGPPSTKLTPHMLLPAHQERVGVRGHVRASVCVRVCVGG